MKFKKLISLFCVTVIVLTAFVGCSSKPSSDIDNSQISINVVTAGDTNMEELISKHVSEIAKEKYPNISLNVVGTGTGDDGSRKIFDKLKAQSDVGKEKWDIDVAIVHQSIMNDMISNNLLDKYVPLTNIGEYLTSDGAKNSLGTDVEGYVIPLFMSQTALAYNSNNVSNPPKSMDELYTWIKSNPKKFGYNGVKGGMSGVAFVSACLYNKDSQAEQIMFGPYGKSVEDDWAEIIAELKSLPVTMTNGNQGTLDMLNRGEIEMGPVWVDMFYSMQAEGRMSKDVRLTLLEPGMPGQPMYIVIPAKAAQKDAAVKIAELLGSAEVQASVIVDKYNWYPGIDSNAVLPLCSDAAKASLFSDITPEVLAEYAKVLPLNQFKNDMMECYENAK